MEKIALMTATVISAATLAGTSMTADAAGRQNVYRNTALITGASCLQRNCKRYVNQADIRNALRLIWQKRIITSK